MKTRAFHNFKIDDISRDRAQQALTLVEMMITMGIYSLVVAGFVSVQIFGLRYDELVCSKLGASEQSRRSYDSLTSDIRSAKVWRIGNGDSAGFSSLPNATLQQGNALQLSLSTDTNNWIRYYFETNAARLCRFASDGSFKVMARDLTNSMYFHAEDYRGTNVSDYQYKYVIVTTMEFCQYQYPLTHVGPGYYYDYYRTQFKVTSHCPN